MFSYVIDSVLISCNLSSIPKGRVGKISSGNAVLMKFPCGISYHSEGFPQFCLLIGRKLSLAHANVLLGKYGVTLVH